MDRVDQILNQWETHHQHIDPSPMAQIGRLTRVARILDRELKKPFAAYGLQFSEFDILATLRRSGPPYRLTGAKLMESTMVTSGAITHRVDRLLAKGLVTREDDPSNRRFVLITLTDEGKDIVEESLNAHLRNEERLLASLDHNQRQQLADLLRRLLIDWGDVPSSPLTATD
ncbi:MarR family winged helix-turn-helix transcriptional regulator [Natronoglycomyces albus]|uniref:MarR family transcriptional regulator n=1 Tax=Natronoglycomyces albus TaxID=2811108 RepID=A0A895XMW5_9ACTN|nr:MarR family transcriptional regulator [Natronoglycomyces albus]QSB06694.1 MarR family transcriptional regulator [Natronoglycomyces albus]